MIKKTLLVMLLLACILFGVSSAAASDLDDGVVASDENETLLQSDLNDLDVSGNAENQQAAETLGASDDGTFTALQSKIDQASGGSTIDLTMDYKYDDNFKTTGIYIDKDITINGNGHVIDAMGKSRILMINYGH